MSDDIPPETISPAACHKVPQGQLVAFQHHNVAQAKPAKVAGNRVADDTTTDYYDRGPFQKGLGGKDLGHRTDFVGKT